jgi:hypothetical protein
LEQAACPGAIAGASFDFRQKGRFSDAVASSKKVTSCVGAAFERGNIARLSHAFA